MLVTILLLVAGAYGRVGDSSSSSQPTITVRILFVSYNNHLATHVNRGSQLISYLLSTDDTTSSVVIMLMR